MNKLLLSVSQLNQYVKSILEGDENLHYIFVSGEISNFSNHYRSGHLYFSLKDSSASISSVMFKSAAATLKFLPQNGMKVIVRGRVSLYERDGSYQLYADEIQPDGAGALHMAYEQLKARLEKEGLFSQERKRPIPKFPEKIGVITSPTGAALQDILSILGRRFPAAQVIFAPVSVQGDNAPSELMEAVGYLNEYEDIDTIILGRGGGSLEELWAFNDETLARAVAKSKIPVISAVGHETDFTICDFVADLRAPTPSAAAEIAVPDQKDILYALDTYEKKMTILTERVLSRHREHLKEIQSKKCFSSPRAVLEKYRLDVKYKNTMLIHSFGQRISAQNERLSLLAGKLDALSPLKVLSRGYAICRTERGILKSIHDIGLEDKLNVHVTDGELICTVNETRERSL